MIRKYLLLICVMFGLSSCLEINYHYIINPNLSGKIKVDYQVPLNPLGLGGNLDDPEGRVAQELTNIFEDFPEVKAWSDIKYQFLNDSNDLKISVVGYFDNFNQLTGKNMFNYEFVNEDGKTYFTFEKFLDSLKNSQKPSKLKSLEELNMTEEQLLDSANKLKSSATLGLGMMSVMMNKFKISTSYEFAGKIYGENGKPIGKNNTLGIKFDWNKLQGYLLKSINDIEYYKNVVRGAKDEFQLGLEGEGNDDAFKKVISAMLSGEEEDISKIRVEFGKPLFDYDSELSVAKKQWEVWKQEHPSSLKDEK